MIWVEFRWEGGFLYIYNIGYPALSKTYALIMPLTVKAIHESNVYSSQRSKIPKSIQFALNLILRLLGAIKRC